VCVCPIRRLSPDPCDAMMVLRHAGPPSATVVSHEEMAQDEDRPPIPIDLSNKHSSSSSPEMPRHLAKNPFLSIIPTTIRPLLSPRTPPNNYLNNNNINTNNNVSKCNNSSSSPRSGESSPRVLEGRNKRKHGTYNESTTSEMRWSGGVLSTEDINSSPDSGLHRDSPGEDEDVAFGKDPTPPLAIRKQSQSLIPLSIIRARYSHKLRADVDQEPMVVMNEDEGGTGISPGSRPKDQVLTKRARLEEMVTHIKSSKDRSRRNSGDDDTSSGGHDVNSSDEVTEDGPTDLRSSSSSSLRARLINSCANGLNLKRVDENDEEDVTLNEEPCNLVCPKNNNYNINNNNNNNNNRSGMSRTEESTLEAWKNANKSPGSKQNLPFSPVEAAKVLGIEPDAYQQQMMQFQLQSAAMLGDPSGLLKAMGPYPPLVYLGYYSQLLHSFQAQEILRQYAMQSNPVNPNPGDKVSIIQFQYNFPLFLSKRKNFL